MALMGNLENEVDFARQCHCSHPGGLVTDLESDLDMDFDDYIYETILLASQVGRGAFPGPQNCFSRGLREIPGHENGPGTNEQGGRLASGTGTSAEPWSSSPILGSGIQIKRNRFLVNLTKRTQIITIID